MLQLSTQSEVEELIGTAFTSLNEVRVNAENELGKFHYSIERFEDFAILRRDFTAREVPLSIPFTCQEMGVHMLFSLEGQSVFNSRKMPFILKPGSHSINYFKLIECNNVLEKFAKQDDVAFRLSSDFYENILVSSLPQIGESLPKMILNQIDFNTINDHLPTDFHLQGILNNILTCPYKGDMKALFVREHLRTLLILQLLHFHETRVRSNIRLNDRKITSRDQIKLLEIKEWIDLNFLDANSLTDLSRKFGINEFKLKHGFKAMFNESPIRYLQQKRLDFSLCLLRDTGKSIKEIADHIGYNHASNFSSAFSKAFGKPPQFFRTRETGLEIYQ
jgi:AraC-like DNA-binding protein